MRVEITYKLVTIVIQYFCFSDKPMKGGGILDLSMTPLTNYEKHPSMKRFLEKAQ